MIKFIEYIIIFFLSILLVFGALEVFIQIYQSFRERGFNTEDSSAFTITGVIIVIILTVYIIVEKPFKK